MRLRNILLLKGYNFKDCQELRRINFLLMLNTDASFKFDLNEDHNVCHLLNNFSQLSKCLYANLTWHLKLDEYLYETLKFSPSWFVLQFLDEIVDSLRFSSSFDVIRQVKNIVESIYTNICRMDYRCSNKSEYLIDQKIIAGKFTDSITSLLRNFNTPVTDDSIVKSKKKLREYIGHSLNCQLELVLSCFRMYQSKPQFEIANKFHIYKINLNNEPETNNYSAKNYSKIINEDLININFILLNTLQNTILNVTLDDFMYWVEIDIDDPTNEDEDLKRDNLQKSIGEQSYEVMDLINNNSQFEHDVVKQLSTISIKPKVLSEVAKDASVGLVLEKIETSPSRVVWLEELLNRRDTLYFNTECLQTIIDNVDIIKLQHLMKIIADHQNFGSMDAEDEEQMKELFLKGGIRQNIEDISVMTEELIRTLGCDYNILQDSEAMFDQEINNYLNKITEDNIEKVNMWTLIFKYPQRFFEKLLEDIDTQDEAQYATALKIISETSTIASNYIKDIIVNSPFNEQHDKKSSRHLLLAGIFKQKIMESKEFVKDIIMSNFTKALSGNDLHSLLMYLQVLKQISHHLKINDLLPPLMIQLAQILDKIRWDLMSYSTVREEIVEIANVNVQELMKTILIHGSGNDREWIKMKINNFKLLTKFYYQKLSLEKGEAIIPFDIFLHSGDFQGQSKAKITSFLCETIVRCTSKECKRLMGNEMLQDSYTEALIIVATIVKKSNQSSPIECLRKCIAVYVKILMVRKSLIKNLQLNLFSSFLC